jgi:hypothetical protein
VPDNWEHLYAMSVETLGLSEAALKSLKRVGVTIVGDCLDHFSRYGSGNCILVHPNFMRTMETEVLSRLVEHGYITPEAAVNFGYIPE